MRHAHPALQADGHFEFLWAHDASRILAFERRDKNNTSERFAVSLNAGEHTDSMELPVRGEIIFALGDVALDGTTLTLPASAGAVVKLAP